MSFLGALLQTFKSLLLGGRHHFRIQFLAAGGACLRRLRGARTRSPRVGLIFVFLHRSPLSRARLSSSGKLKLRGSAQSPPGDGAQVVMIIADGARPAVLARHLAGGDLPALAALRDEGTLASITSAFPSVTGPAYAPFLMGRFPGGVGLPGLRWYDRSRRIT